METEDKMESQGRDQEVNAERYMREHRIRDLFENLTAALVYERPEDPKLFIKEHLEELMKARDHGCPPPSLLDESNIHSLFSMMDLNKTGFIKLEQYHAGMQSMGVKEYNQTPIGSEIDKITLETFTREAKESLKKAVGTYA